MVCILMVHIFESLSYNPFGTLGVLLGEAVVGHQLRIDLCELHGRNVLLQIIRVLYIHYAVDNAP